MTLTRALILVLGGAALAGCDRGAPAPVPAPPAEQQARPAAEAAAVTTSAAAAADALAELHRLDPRRPVPLQPMMAWHQKQNMQAHLVAVQRITDALSREDWEGVRSAAATIGTSPEMQRMCRHMGAGAEGFAELALEFHRRADGIGEAAATKDVGAVLRATSSALQTCTGCHAAYRQDVVDAGTWTRRTGSTLVPGAGH